MTENLIADCIAADLILFSDWLASLKLYSDWLVNIEKKNFKSDTNAQTHRQINLIDS